MPASKLVKPDIEYKDSYLEALDEYHAEGRYQFIDKLELDHNFEEWVKELNSGERHMHKPYADWVEPVPETVLWLVKGDKYLGTFNIRHRLNWHLEKWGGHVNFMIRPSSRGKGFGKKILQKGMPYVCHFGIDRALITLSPKNKAAIRIVEFCGAKLEDKTSETTRFPERLRYWLSCN
ncbi:MAG: GNAT family N-acetyltransferase [Micavibrio sp. TMED27]|nr:GNAT family N-acetyltransferase [Micavibrio sp.]OUT89932.1 MAG: GNAT family N-acetyltransferase [Micavibrio sp. TMED27]